MRKKILAAALAVLLTGCSPPSAEDMESLTVSDTAQADTISDTEETAETIEVMETEEIVPPLPLTEKSYSGDMLSEEYMKLLGRTHNEDGILWLPHSASGVEFTMDGTYCSVTLAGDSASQSSGRARFAAYVDGERVLDEMISEKEMTFEIFVSEELEVSCTTESSSQSETEIMSVEIGQRSKEITVRLVKLSEALQSTVGLKSVDVVSRGDISPTAEKDLKIEFIGDSLTCGYGVDDEVSSHHFSTTTEDCTKAFAYRTAQILDADYSLVSYSGFGIVSGYTSVKGVKSGDYVVPDMYETLAYSGGSYNGYNVGDTRWDFSRFQPDVVVICLGANDQTYTGSSEELMREYTDGYVGFLKKIRGHNPDAYFVCCLGLVSDGLFDAVCAAAEEYSGQTGDDRISVLHFPVQDGTTGFAADYHPTAATYDEAAALLAEKIRSEVIGRTSPQIIADN
ncbi:MAG: GDSL family lipase [Oscillospiraceae bacterium]|nr:GDSL family lipase [Oscillospiraceae bacterium]